MLETVPLSRQQKRKRVRNFEKFWKLKSRDGKLSKRLITEFVSNMEIGMYNLILAGTGVGKTHHVIQEFSPNMVIEKGVKFITFIAPEKVVISKSTINKHLKQLKRKVGLVTDLWNPTQSEIISALENREEDEVVFMVMTDSAFNKRVDLLKNEILRHNLDGKTFFTFDECHISATSEAENYLENTGLKNINATCIKFNNIEKILDIVWTLGVSATLVKEQIDSEFGSDRYQVINSPILKEDIFLSVSGHRPTQFYDSTDMESTIMEFFGYVTSHQMYIDSLHNQYGLPLDLNPKMTGMVTLETRYKDKDKDDTDKFIEFMDNPNMTIPKNWTFDVALDTSTELEVWRFDNGSITKMTEEERESAGYYDSDSIVKKMSEKNSFMRFLILVGKGSVGMDILPLNFALSLRTFTNKVNGEPVTHKGIQILGRCRRLVIPIEDLTPHFDNVYKCLNYYTNVNFYQAFLPDSDYWRKTQERIDNELPSIDEIEKMIHSKLD